MTEPRDKIVIAEFMDAAAVDVLRMDFHVVHDPDLWANTDSLEQTLSDAAALIVRNKTRVTAAVIAAAPGLRAIGRLGVGLDNIALEACTANNVAVLPATGANALSVAEYVVTTAMMLLRRGYYASGAVAAGEWPRERLIGREVSGCTLGLLGFGSIGQVVARTAAVLGFEILAHDPKLPVDDPAWRGVRRSGFDALLRDADVVSLHMPLVEATRGLIDRQALSCMKPDAILINTARGGIVDEQALIAALRDGTLAGAALDVFEAEPLDAESGMRFADVPNLVLTPHIAGVTRQSNIRVSMITARNVRRILMEKK